MIHIAEERCTGCGACVDACPYGAMYLVNGKAALDATLCRECAACASACPAQAIALVEPAAEPAIAAERAPVRRFEPESVGLQTEPRSAPLRAKVLPVLGVALSWAGRELAPRLADYLLSRLDSASGRGTDAAIRPGGDLSALGRPVSGREWRWRTRSRRGRQ